MGQTFFILIFVGFVVLFVCFFLMKSNLGKAEERSVWRKEGMRGG